MQRKAVIFGIKGAKLTTEERDLIKNEKPWGVILFSRNIKDLNQLRHLITEIKYNINDKNFPILIDQEGGSVSRLNTIIDFSIFSQKFFEKLYSRDKNIFYQYYKIYIEKVCDILNRVGININTVPVLDVRRKISHRIMVDRCFSENPNLVTKLGNLCINLFKNKKIATVIKHMPGHGLAKCDSHYNLPVIKAKKTELINKDFKPFRSCQSFFAMTAHVIYATYDPIYTATHSKIIINDVIRKQIGFKGLLISDDISMKALKYDLLTNAKKSLSAGCNLVLYCAGNYLDCIKLMKEIPFIDKFTQKKTSEFYKFLS